MELYFILGLACAAFIFGCFEVYFRSKKFKKAVEEHNFNADYEHPEKFLSIEDSSQRVLAYSGGSFVLLNRSDVIDIRFDYVLNGSRKNRPNFYIEFLTKNIATPSCKVFFRNNEAIAKLWFQRLVVLYNR